jgi:hypothetical protein
MTPETLSERIARLEVDMVNLKAILPQFNAHLIRSNRFFDQHEQEEETRKYLDEKRARLHYWLLGILSALIIASILGTAAWIGNFLNTHHISSSTTTLTESAPQNARQ